MINIAAVIPTVVAKVKKMPPGHCIELQTFKRDRSITIVKETEDSLQVIEKGFQDELFQVEVSKLKKLLKTLLKREFPRSNKVRLYPGTFQPPL